MRCLIALAMLVCMRADAQNRIHEHVQYTGTIERRVPDSRSAPLTMNVWGSTDSTFRGYMTIGAPLGRSGAMFGRFVKESLEFTSVSESGDSIRWRSSGVGLQLTGDYEILGGAGVGQSGTWSVALAHGTALASPGSKPAGSISPLRSDWPWWLLLASVTLAVVWGFAHIWRHGDAAVVEWSFPVTDADARLRGVGGWLTWFLFLQIVGLLLTLYRIRMIWSVFHGLNWMIGEILPALRPTIAMESVLHILSLVIQPIGVVLTARLDRRARQWWMLFYALAIAYRVADFAGGQHLLAVRPSIVGVEGARRAAEETLFARDMNSWALANSILWLLYWCRSRRVRLNFGPVADGWNRKAEIATA